MALIKYTQFIGIRTAENGSNGFITNSTNYSMLIVYFDGSREIVEGDARAMRPFLPYLKEDNTAQILQESLTQLENKLEQMVDTRIERIFAVKYPVPAVVGLREDEAIAKLTAAGFQVKMANTYPEGMPLGQVKACHRENENYLTVVLDVRHDLPEVVNLPEDEAVARLEQAGFTVKLMNICPEGTPKGKVFACIRADEKSTVVSLDVRHELPEVTGLPEAEAKEILAAAGFQVKTIYLDQLNLDYAVTAVDRNDPRKMDVVLRVASRQFNVTGLDVEEAKRIIEATGYMAVIERRRSDHVAAGIVMDWRERNGSIMLHVSSGSDDLTASSVHCQITVADGTEVECRNVVAVYSWKNKSLELSLEMKHAAKSRYVFGEYCHARVEDKSSYAKPKSSLASAQVEPEQWHPAKFVIEGVDYADRQPAAAEVGIFSSYGIFKKDVAWNLKFDFKW